jgi:hypothetical protein
LPAVADAHIAALPSVPPSPITLGAFFPITHTDHATPGSTPFGVTPMIRVDQGHVTSDSSASRAFSDGWRSLFLCQQWNLLNYAAVGGCCRFITFHPSRSSSTMWPAATNTASVRNPNPVYMDQPMSHADHLAPGNVGIAITQLLGHLGSRLTDDLKASDHGILMQFAGGEVGPVQFDNKRACVLRCEEHIQQKHIVR